MSWRAMLMGHGGEAENCEVEGADVTEAMLNALEEFGIDCNDEGRYVIELSGEAGE